MGAATLVPPADATDDEERAFQDAVASMDPDPAEPTAGAQLSLSFAVGGKKPTSASLSMVGGKVEIGDEFKKGDIVRVTYEARVVSVSFVDVLDPKTGQVVACERRQKARAVAPPTIERL